MKKNSGNKCREQKQNGHNNATQKYIDNDAECPLHGASHAWGQYVTRTNVVIISALNVTTLWLLTPMRVQGKTNANPHDRINAIKASI